jgi:hypothetical protein
MLFILGHFNRPNENSNHFYFILVILRHFDGPNQRTVSSLIYLIYFDLFNLF